MVFSFHYAHITYLTQSPLQIYIYIYIYIYIPNPKILQDITEPMSRHNPKRREEGFPRNKNTKKPIKGNPYTRPTKFLKKIAKNYTHTSHKLSESPVAVSPGGPKILIMHIYTLE